MRLLGVDYGDKRTGIAVSDPLGWTAQGVETVSGDLKKTVNRICELAAQYEVSVIVVGYPLNMNGTAGYRADRTELFISKINMALGNSAISIVKWDERLTSAAAAKTMMETGGRPTARKVREKGSLDVLSAALILQSYLDRLRNDQIRNNLL